MINHVSTENTPNLKWPLMFFSLGLIGLIFLAILMYGHRPFPIDRWDPQIIFAVHVFILGFMLPIMLGALVQLLPVGFSYSSLEVVFPIFICSIIPFFLGHFIKVISHSSSDHNSLFVSIIFVSVIFLFCSLIVWIYLKEFFYSILHHSKVHFLGLIISLSSLAIGVIIGLTLILNHSGFDPFNQIVFMRPFLTNLHAEIMLIGFVFVMIQSVSILALPMFFVTNSFNQLRTSRIFITLLFCLFFSVIFYKNEKVLFVLNLLIILCLLIQSLDVLRVLWSRKRRLLDPIVVLWFFGICNCILVTLTWLVLLFAPSIEYYNFQVMFGGFILFGVIMPIILAMILKIVPFLVWLHLNNKLFESKRYDIQVPNAKSIITNLQSWIVVILVILINVCLLVNLQLEMSIILFVTGLLVFCYLILAIFKYIKVSRLIL